MKAVEAHQAAEAERARRQEEARAAEEARREEYATLRQPQATEAGAAEQARLTSAREETLWESLVQNGADFTMEADVDAEEMKARAQLNEDIDTFGIWNPTRAAADLGFQFGPEPDAPSELMGVRITPEEDAFLADLLAQTGTLHSGHVQAFLKTH